MTHVLLNPSLSGVQSISRILDTLCEKDANNTKLIRSLERADATTPEHGASPTSSSEAKRKRAKERQAKLLKQFASKQRIFEAHMESGGLQASDFSNVVLNCAAYSKFIHVSAIYFCSEIDLVINKNLFFFIIFVIFVRLLLYFGGKKHTKIWDDYIPH